MRMEGRARYAGARYAPEVKEVLGALEHGLRQRGWSVADLQSFCSDCGYAVGEETLRLWTNASGAGRPIISNAKKMGARKKLDDEGRLKPPCVVFFCVSIAAFCLRIVLFRALEHETRVATPSPSFFSIGTE